MSARAAKLSAATQELLPLHVAVIMDGNGRWAKERGLPRIEGHRRGAESARAIIKAASESGIRYLTLYTFSVENWNRPKTEVDAIMKYLAYYLKKESPELDRNNVQLEAIGQIHRLPEPVQKQLENPGNNYPRISSRHRCLPEPGARGDCGRDAGDRQELAIYCRKRSRRHCSVCPYCQIPDPTSGSNQW